MLCDEGWNEKRGEARRRAGGETGFKGGGGKVDEGQS